MYLDGCLPSYAQSLHNSKHLTQADSATLTLEGKTESESAYGKTHLTIGGYVENYYSYNFNRPGNNITALRGFDFLHNSITLGNAVLSADASHDNFIARIALNFGSIPSQFYEQEPVTIPSYNLPRLDHNTFQYIQEALIGWHVKSVNGLTIQAGIMATPIGVEGLANFQSWEESVNSKHLLPKDYRENWNWSRSNAFINVPDYHTGVRMLYSPNPTRHFSLYLVNGANSVTDNNKWKTFAFSYLWMPSPKLQMSMLYMSGPERDPGFIGGAKSWRHLFDTWARWEVTRNFSLMTQFTPGMEQTSFGTNIWTINVLYASWKFDNDVRLAFRYEHLLEKAAKESESVFLRSLDENNKGGLYGYTTTLSLPIVPNHLMMRLEYRHDSSKLNWFYKGTLQPTNDSHQPFIPNAKNQNTLTMGLVGWF